MYIDRKEGGQRVFIENLTKYDVLIRSCCLYSGGVMPFRREGSAVGKYNAKSLKQGSKRFNFITRTIHFAHLGILFIYVPFLLQNYAICMHSSGEDCNLEVPKSFKLVK